MLLPKKLFGKYEVNFPLENNLSFIIGPNGSGKTQTLLLLKDYFENQNENVLYFPADRILDITIEDVRKALETLDSITIAHSLSENQYDMNLFHKYGLKLDRLEFDLIHQYNCYINSGFIQIVNFITKIINAGEDVIVLIDTPERSLHMQIMRTFIEDLKYIWNVKKMIVVTHSPEILAGYFKKRHNCVVDINTCINLK